MEQKQDRKWLAAGIAGGVFGLITGALIGASLAGNSGIVPGAILVGLYQGVIEALTDWRRQPGQLKPLWHRIVGTTLLGAAFGGVLASVFGVLAAGVIVGVSVGLLGLGPRKLLLGTVIGVIGGLAGQALGLNGALLGGAIVLAHRLLQVIIFQDTEPIQLTGERMRPEDARYVVPYEARTAYIGTEYMQTLAEALQGTFQRNQPDIGLVDTLDALRGPHCDPARIAPPIRDFYEHTVNYRLAIEPEWNPFMQPFFGLFKAYIAQRIGQANLPFDIEEAQRGVVSYIDSIDLDGEQPEHIRTLRGWIRAFETTGEAIYVGVYTVVRHHDVGYISVGFPLPEGNFSATLLPYNHRGDGLLLTTRDTDDSFTGHYISDIDNDTGALTTLKLPTFHEEIEVYLQDGHLRTDHRFYLGDFRFLTLYYSIEPKGGAI
jgi:hypothetical protein